MNLLENYIKEIHDESDVKVIDGHEFILVDITYSCYGRIKRQFRTFELAEWEKAKKDGYFMA